MPREQRTKLTVCLACRQREHLEGSSGYIGYIQDWVFYPLTVTQPAKGVKARAVECEHCGATVTVFVASRRSALISQYLSVMIAFPIGLLAVLPFLVLPPLRNLSEKAGGGPWAGGLIAFGVYLIVMLVIAYRCFATHYVLHAVKTTDLKHRILPGQG